LIVDASVNGALLSKFYNETYEILEMIANKNHQWLSTKQATTRVTSGVHNVGALIALSAQETSLINMVKAMTNTQETLNQITKVSCVYCGERYLFDNCPRNPTLVNYVGNCNRQNQNNPYSNTYNLG